MKLSALAFILLILLAGCSTTSRQTVALLNKHVRQKKYDAAIELVKSKKFYPEERSKLLKFLEVGMLHHMKGNYYQSLQSFDKARNLSNKLYTVSVSKKVLATVANASADNYYGERYERSLLRFYLALNHYMLFQQGYYEAYELKDEKEKIKKVAKKVLEQSQRQRHLAASRAVILEWDTLLESYKASKLGKSTYKDDMSAKLFGGLIHEQIGSSADLQIARQLYLDAKTLLDKNYNAYPVYNHKSTEFRSNFDKFHKLGIKKVKKQFVKSGKHSKQLVSFINKSLKAIKRKKQKKHNVSVIVQLGLIAPKTPNIVKFPLPMGRIPVMIVPNNAKHLSPLAFTLVLLSLSSGIEPYITFELPQVLEQKTLYSTKLLVKDETGKVVKRVALPVINPLSDMAHEAMDEKKALAYTTIGTRVAVKHALAIAAAYTAYISAVKRGSGSGLGLLLATGMYALSNKAIKESERADIRYWSTLPHDLRMGKVSLKAGAYSFYLEKEDDKKQVSTVFLGRKIIKKAKRSKQVLNFRVI
ncbi:MAG: hypothetical protein ISR65_17370 [Bacteriovoracaceae bacterium]|nr:hypothetical protein [Bacteriovoracaceae bacterium]